MAKLPAPRNFNAEGVFCEAIRERRLVRLRYEGDTADRLFAPHVVYTSTAGKVLVTGIQVENPSAPLDNLEPRNFEIGRIASLNPTSFEFQPNQRLNRNLPKYSNGVICSV